MLRLIILLWLGCGLLVQASDNDLSCQAGETEPAADVRRRQLQETNRYALVRLRNLLSEHLSQTPATVSPYPTRAVGRRRKLATAARPLYETQCLYEPPETATHPGIGRCYLNPMVLAHASFDAPSNPLETMLLKSAWTAYQCSFENRKGRCGTSRYPPYDCRWQDDQGRCAVTSDYLLPRLLAYLHCRDDAVLTPFWDRCYALGLVPVRGNQTGDSDLCGQPDGNWARCWWFAARNESEVDLCAPSPQGGVESRDAYDELVGQMRNGIWIREWFGSCPTADIVYTIKSACNYTDADECANDPVCTLRPDLPIEYGMCRLRDGLIWNELFRNYTSGSTLFEAMAAYMQECAEASANLETCMAAGRLAPEPGGPVPLDPDKFNDVVDLVFIEEVTPGSAAGPRALSLVTLLAAAAATAAATSLLSRTLR